MTNYGLLSTIYKMILRNEYVKAELPAAEKTPCGLIQSNSASSILSSSLITIYYGFRFTTSITVVGGPYARGHSRRCRDFTERILRKQCLGEESCTKSILLSHDWICIHNSEVRLSWIPRLAGFTQTRDKLTFPCRSHEMDNLTDFRLDS